MKWDTEEIATLIENYSFKTKNELLNLFPNRSYDAIKLMAAKLKLKKEINELISGNLNKLLEETPEAYYWIGFIMADGTINHNNNRLKVSLSELDEKHLIKLMFFLDMDLTKLKHYVTDMIEFQIMDNFTLPKIIKKFDFKPSKTYNPPNLSYLNDNDCLFISFLSGFIDGDGSIIKKKDKEEYRISIRLHKNWFDNLSFIKNKICSLTNLSLKGLYKYDVSMLVISDFRVLRFLKLQSEKLKLPILNRKWDKINLKRKTKYEK